MARQKHSYDYPRPAVTVDVALFTVAGTLQNLRLWDHYRRAKIRAEELCRAYPGDWTIIRPSWFWGAGTTVGLVGFFKRRLPA